MKGVTLHEGDVQTVQQLYSAFVNLVATVTGQSFTGTFTVTLKGAGVRAAYKWEADGVPIGSLFSEEEVEAAVVQAQPDSGEPAASKEPRIVTVGDVVSGRRGLPYTVHAVSADAVRLVTDTGEIVDMTQTEAGMYFNGTVFAEPDTMGPPVEDVAQDDETETSTDEPETSPDGDTDDEWDITL